jgi:acyl-coenzyme A thioesterase PaaI-like protein
MADSQASHEAVIALNASAAFNVWAGFEVVAASAGKAELRLAWRPDLGQYAGFLHAAMIGGMIDTACGFAAFTLVGDVMASHFSVDCLAPAAGDAFLARGRVVKAGRRQVFTHAELFALRGAEEKLVATGTAILIPVTPAQDVAVRAPRVSPARVDAPVR